MLTTLQSEGLKMMAFGISIFAADGLGRCRLRCATLALDIFSRAVLECTSWIIVKTTDGTCEKFSRVYLGHSTKVRSFACASSTCRSADVGTFWRFVVLTSSSLPAKVRSAKLN
ncbi:Uncharacterized protein TCM_043103 [Theobroma cacao]|uniref:Uncharacterized protein n=1 Tax=Theobroma cacao TaxID=3641 RepID=A0A061FUW4_THECC|nr:Uncharacterized protein TCM_043103 [Theobroma cacao]